LTLIYERIIVSIWFHNCSNHSVNLADNKNTSAALRLSALTDD